MYADLHCDTFYRCFQEKKSFSDNSLHINADRVIKISPYIQTFAHYIPDRIENKFEFFQSMLENTLKIMEDNSKFLLFKTVSDIEKAEKENKILAVLSVEGGGFFEDSKQKNLEIIDFLSRNHVKFLSLCYNDGNHLCSGAMSKTDSGISKLGLNAAYMLNENNIVSDVSHLSFRSTSEILDLDIKAVATHSCCFSICEHPRNIKDDAICKLISKGGLLGLNLYSPFLGSKRLEKVIEHIEHIKRLGGENIIALGCDFDGCDDLPSGINGVDDISRLYDLIPCPDGLFYYNVRNFLKNI